MHGKLKNANASDIMNKSVVTVKEEENIEQVAKIMAEKRIGSVIVEDDSNEPKGIITESDVIRSIAKNGKNFFSMKAVNVMSSPLITIIPSMDVEKVEKEMKRRNVKHLPVVISGRLVGIVTSIDVVTYLGKWEGHD
jgi:CBS domain-containing protein